MTSNALANGKGRVEFPSQLPKEKEQNNRNIFYRLLRRH